MPRLAEGRRELRGASPPRAGAPRQSWALRNAVFSPGGDGAVGPAASPLATGAQRPRHLHSAESCTISGPPRPAGGGNEVGAKRRAKPGARGRSRHARARAAEEQVPGAEVRQFAARGGKRWPAATPPHGHAGSTGARLAQSSRRRSQPGRRRGLLGADALRLLAVGLHGGAQRGGGASSAPQRRRTSTFRSRQAGRGRASEVHSSHRAALRGLQPRRPWDSHRAASVGHSRKKAVDALVREEEQASSAVAGEVRLLSSRRRRKCCPRVSSWAPWSPG